MRQCWSATEPHCCPQVTCPQELTQVTSFRRADQDDFGFEHGTVPKSVHSSTEARAHFDSGERLYYDNSDLSQPCGFTAQTGTGDYCLSRMCAGMHCQARLMQCLTRVCMSQDGLSKTVSQLGNECLRPRHLRSQLVRHVRIAQGPPQLYDRRLHSCGAVDH